MRKRDQHLALAGAMVLVILEGCSSSKSPEETVPHLPRISIASFRPAIRDQLRRGYAEAAAKPGDAEASGRLGMLLQAYEQTESAEICYRRARALDPQRFEWAYYLGLTQALSGKNEEAAATLEGALRIDREYLPARLKLVEVLITLGRLDESESVCQAMIRDAPDAAPVYYWAGRVASAKGRMAAAIDRYRKASQLWPSYGTAHYALALALRQTGATAEAEQHIAAYQKYKADGDPQPEDRYREAVRALDNGALAHLMKGVDLENAGQIEAAIAEHEAAVSQDPKLAQAHANLIALYARAARGDMAEREYRETVALNPNLPQSHYDYGVFLVSAGRFRDAESAFRKALASSPNYAEAHSNLGALLEREGKTDEALREYQNAIDDKPNFRQAHFQLGRLLLLRKKTGEAIAQLTQTLTPQDNDTPRFLYALGVAYIESGDAVRAQRYLRQAGEGAASLGQEQLSREIAGTLRKLEERTGH
jgi:tetratricopeptide (TPR) repeat protein